MGVLFYGLKTGWICINRDSEQLLFQPLFLIFYTRSTRSVRQQDHTPQMQTTAVTAAGLWKQQLIKSIELEVWIKSSPPVLGLHHKI